LPCMFREHNTRSASLVIFLDNKLQKWDFIGSVPYRFCTSDTQMVNGSGANIFFKKKQKSSANMKAGAYEKDDFFF